MSGMQGRSPQGLERVFEVSEFHERAIAFAGSSLSRPDMLAALTHGDCSAADLQSPAQPPATSKAKAELPRAEEEYIQVLEKLKAHLTHAALHSLPCGVLLDLS